MGGNHHYADFYDKGISQFLNERLVFVLFYVLSLPMKSMHL